MIKSIKNTGTHARTHTRTDTLSRTHTQVELGKIKQIDVQTGYHWTQKKTTFTSLQQEGYDSIQLVGPASGDEFVVYNYHQVTILSVVALT